MNKFDIIIQHVDFPQFYLDVIGTDLSHAEALLIASQQGGKIIPTCDRNKYQIWCA